ILQPGSIILLDDLDYEDDRYTLLPGQNKELGYLLNLLKDRPGLTVVLENHTETNGPAEYNQDLSRGRVAAIRDFLVARGIRPDRLQVIAHGESVPRNNCGDNEGCPFEDHLRNRRTEVRIISMGL
ncbi:MAG: OmpA family protein, partial [Bacteroidota bacterium]